MDITKILERLTEILPTMEKSRVNTPKWEESVNDSILKVYWVATILRIDILQNKK